MEYSSFKTVYIEKCKLTNKAGIKNKHILLLNKKQQPMKENTKTGAVITG